LQVSSQILQTNLQAFVSEPKVIRTVFNGLILLSMLTAIKKRGNAAM
jgi:hypothetical protein